MSETSPKTAPSQTGGGGAITLGAPSSVAVGVGQPNLVPGIHLYLSGKAAVGETFVVTIMNDSGSINASDARGAQFSGARPTCITITGTLAQVNAALATLTDQAPASGTDTMTFVASDSLGDNTPTLYAPVTIAGAPTIAAPESETVKTGVATRLTGLSVAETNASSGERFTVTLTDTIGVFTDTGGGVSGSGTHSLTLRGGLSLLNADLKRLDLTASAADTIHETITDSFGNTAAPVSVSVSVTASGPAARFAQAAAGLAGAVSAAAAAPMGDAQVAIPLALAARGGHGAFA
jgi:hypothetical protein